MRSESSPAKEVQKEQILELQPLTPAKDVVLVEVTEVEVVALPAWHTGYENEEEWNQHLVQFKRKWVWALIVTVAPSWLLFLVPLFFFLATGEWFSVGTTTMYNKKTMPSVLNNHMILACLMLVAMIIQMILACCLSKKSSKPGDLQHRLHRRCGWVTGGLVMICTICGTLALAFCDIGPKRGMEATFFVYIGIIIAIYTAKAMQFAYERKYGLHMQYIYAAMFTCSSPGWNRIWLIMMRLTLGGTKAFTDKHYIACFARTVDVTLKGAYFTWSFVAAMTWFLVLWLVVFKLPFFKRNSSGFWMWLISMLILGVCVWEMITNWTEYGTMGPEDFKCTDDEIDTFFTYETAVDNHGRFGWAMTQGLCMPFNAKGQKIADLFANPNTTYLYPY